MGLTSWFGAVSEEKLAGEQSAFTTCYAPIRSPVDLCSFAGPIVTEVAMLGRQG
jgi:hypothetical protein